MVKSQSHEVKKLVVEYWKLLKFGLKIQFPKRISISWLLSICVSEQQKFYFDQTKKGWLLWTDQTKSQISITSNIATSSNKETTNRHGRKGYLGTKILYNSLSFEKIRNYSKSESKLLRSVSKFKIRSRGLF
ncbi:hypothetical protein BpHYR1_022718 [Brachionus plicatilis]|uniref:Uncharacterized protein n=1 Tax=Brachionus plicatilis TaxID=10195 RepID=A0A3M7T6T9_BRAPC|nr:hypothetical protein BpHYR1_022718 [Brachionus plicatilis]